MQGVQKYGISDRTIKIDLHRCLCFSKSPITNYLFGSEWPFLN